MLAQTIVCALLLVVCSSTGAEPASNKCPADCSADKPCPGHEAKSCETWTLDICDCCKVCEFATQGEPCGGPSTAKLCTLPLECVADDSIGRIADIRERGRCLERNCSTIECPAFTCPEDSYALPSVVSSGRCCPLQQGCACLPGDCLSPDCPPDTIPKLVKRGNQIPGSCCDTYECAAVSSDGSCRVDKQTYKNGETWRNKCGSCSCRNGVANCHDYPCKGVDTHCSWLHKAEGECCPLCLGCLTSSGRQVNNSEQWKEDDCTWCECVAGRAKCETQMCETKCVNAVKQPGMCCPACEKPSQLLSIYQHHGPNGTQMCSHGNRSVWRDKCRQCACHDGREFCSPIACPRTYCDHPILEPGSCCPICLNDAASPFQQSPASAAVCQGLDGHVHREGDTWWLDDCTQCVCIEGLALCDSAPCPAAPCANPVKKPGQCCAACADNDHLGSNHSNQLPCSNGMKHGQTWRPEPCLSCICRAGKEHCYRDMCPVLSCLEPLFFKDKCCPACPAPASKSSINCHTDGKMYQDGALWAPDNCKRCHCVSGQVKCFEMGCQHDLCRSSGHTSGCCAHCPEVVSNKFGQCTLGSLTFADGEHRALDNCNRCQCDRGRLRCQETMCPQDFCRTRNHSSGNCCMQCPELERQGTRERAGFITAVVVLVGVLAIMGSYTFYLWRKHVVKGYARPVQQPAYKKTANGYV
ncbi:cysteine-rich motor neuron 1 protein-like [Ornithodoros turicata]|uniref:cysteine-rich motor neuron 1 protein-like n=1 Tax=Ornithodoros turicata TaxID=34597 RepID=UPI0031398255